MSTFSDSVLPLSRAKSLPVRLHQGTRLRSAATVDTDYVEALSDSPEINTKRGPIFGRTTSLDRKRTSVQLPAREFDYSIRRDISLRKRYRPPTDETKAIEPTKLEDDHSTRSQTTCQICQDIFDVEEMFAVGCVYKHLVCYPCMVTHIRLAGKRHFLVDL